MQNCSTSNCELLRAAKSWLSSPLPAPLHSSNSRDPTCRLLRVNRDLQCLRSWTPSFTFPLNFERLRSCFIAPRTHSEFICRLRLGKPCDRRRRYAHEQTSSLGPPLTALSHFSSPQGLLFPSITILDDQELSESRQLLLHVSKCQTPLRVLHFAKYMLLKRP